MGLKKKRGFVQRSGLAFTLNGRPFRFVGINMYTALWADYEWRDVLATALPQLQGANAVRTFAVQASAIKEGARSWASWDAALGLFAQYNLKVIMVLTDQHGAQPITDSVGERPLAWYQGGYKTTVEGVATYRNWVAEAVTRYRDNSTIGMWQLINEGTPQDGTEADAKAALRAFADDVGGLVKSIDRNHLVSLGSTSGGVGTIGTDYSYVYASPPIDVCDYHDYDFPDSPMGLTEPTNGLQGTLTHAASIGKPLIVGETGIHWLAADPPITRAERATLFDAKLSAQFAAGVAGELLWAWHDAPVSADPARDLDIMPDDPALALLAKYR